MQEAAVLSRLECLLKAENYIAAARLDPSNESLAAYLRQAALWRAQATRLRIGGSVQPVNEPHEPVDFDILRG